MSLLDKLADKALNAKKKYLKSSMLIASGIIDYTVGTYEEMTAHSKALGMEAAEEDGMRDYDLYKNAVLSSGMVEGGIALLAAEYCPSKLPLYLLGPDLLVRDINLIATVLKQTRMEKSGQPGTVKPNMSGLIGTARTLAYKLANRRKSAPAEAEPAEDDAVVPLIFPDPLPEPPKEDEMRIMGPKPGLEEEISDSAVEEPGDDVLQFEPAPALAEELPPGPFDQKPCPEPLRLPGPGEGYELPDIMEPEDKPEAGYHPQQISEDEVAADTPGDDAPQMPSSKPKVDIGPLSRLPDDDDDPLGSASEENTGNTLF